jgi:hypothetical protein
VETAAEGILPILLRRVVHGKTQTTHRGETDNQVAKGQEEMARVADLGVDPMVDLVGGETPHRIRATPPVNPTATAM